MDVKVVNRYFWRSNLVTFAGIDLKWEELRAWREAVLSRAGLLHVSNWGAVFPSFACHFTFPLQFPP